MHQKKIHLQILRAIDSNPGLMQLQVVHALGVSLRKAHYCMRALLEKGLVKMSNFSHSQKKCVYAYILTPSGIKSKAILTVCFLERKAAKYVALKSELENIGGVLKETGVVAVDSGADY